MASSSPKELAEIIVLGTTILGGEQLLQGSGFLIENFVRFAKEIYDRKNTCAKLISRIQSMHEILSMMLRDGYIEDEKMLQEFASYLANIQEFFEQHKERGVLHAIVHHGSMQSQIGEYVERLDHFVHLSVVLLRKEAAEHFAKAKEHHEDAQQHHEETRLKHKASMKQLNILRIELAQQRRESSRNMAFIAAKLEQQKEEKFTTRDLFQALEQRSAKEILDELHQEGGNTLLKDLFCEWKRNTAGYTEPQLAQMERVLKIALQKGKIDRDQAQLQTWFNSTNSVIFDNRNPFATRELRSLYFGKLKDCGVPVAIRTVNVNGDSKDPAIAKEVHFFKREVIKWSTLNNPYIVPMFGANHTSKPLMLIFAKAAHGNFRQYLETHPHRLWNVFADAARGLTYMHQRDLVHDNLKCANLLVNEYGVGMISDFGFAYVRSNASLSSKVEQEPSYNWIAPERANNPDSSRGVKESDIYSLGMCLYEAIAGHPPFDGIEEMEAIELIKRGEMPKRDVGKFSDTVWDFICAMCRYVELERMQLPLVIETMIQFAHDDASIAAIKECHCPPEPCMVCGGTRSLQAGKAVSQEDQVSEDHSSAHLQTRLRGLSITNISEKDPPKVSPSLVHP